MNAISKFFKSGYTIVELMVTVLIISLLAVSVGAFFVSLLNIQEKEREDAYVREKLNDICATYADMLSVGSFFVTNSDRRIIVNFPREAGGVSLETGGTFETGSVIRVACLTSSVNRVSRDYTSLDLNVSAMDADGFIREKGPFHFNGNAELLPLLGNITSCRLTRLGTNDVGFASLGCLEIEAEYEVKNRLREKELRTATARRVVRLWNGD